MKNKIYKINEETVNKYVQKWKNDKDIFLAEINGELVVNLDDYLKIISEIFKFPILSKIVDGYLDWITDLSWIEEKSIVIVIYNYKNFMSDDRETKEDILKDLKEDVLYFWEEEVKRVVVGGKPRSFNVYLVD